MKLPRPLLGVLLLALAFASGCNRNRKKVIAVIPKGTAQQFWQTVHAGAVKASRESGVDILWNGTATETDYNGQLQLIETMINRRVDAIAVAPIDRKVVVSAVERAAREKIPLIIYDSAIDTDRFTAQVATDNFYAGEMAAERMGAILNGKGRIAVLKVQPGAASSMAREEGFEKKIKAGFPGIEIVAEQYGWADYAKSLSAAENILTAHPNLDAIFGPNETSTVGAARALKQRKSTVKLVGFDFSPTLLEDLQSGLIDSLVVQDPFRMGYEAVRLAVAASNGQTLNKMNNLAPKLVTRDNLNTPEVQQRISPDIKQYLE
jgi:ribose transport system substrate-binding protein